MITSIRTKSEFLRLASLGLVANQLPSWDTVEQAAADGYHGDVMIRYRDAMASGKGWLRANTPMAEVPSWIDKFWHPRTPTTILEPCDGGPALATLLVPYVNYDPKTGRTFKPDNYNTDAATAAACALTNTFTKENITPEDVKACMARLGHT